MLMYILQWPQQTQRRLETTRRELSGQKLVRNTNQSRSSWWHGRCLIGRGKSTDEEHLSVESRDSTNLTLTLATGEGGGRTGEKAADGGGRRRWRVSRRVAVADEIAASPLSLRAVDCFHGSLGLGSVPASEYSGIFFQGI
jgi:hypothetical protein